MTKWLWIGLLGLGACLVGVVFTHSFLMLSLAVFGMILLTVAMRRDNHELAKRRLREKAESECSHKERVGKLMEAIKRECGLHGISFDCELSLREELLPSWTGKSTPLQSGTYIRVEPCDGVDNIAIILCNEAADHHGPQKSAADDTMSAIVQVLPELASDFRFYWRPEEVDPEDYPSIGVLEDLGIEKIAKNIPMVMKECDRLWGTLSPMRKKLEMGYEQMEKSYAQIGQIRNSIIGLASPSVATSA